MARHSSGAAVSGSKIKEWKPLGALILLVALGLLLRSLLGGEANRTAGEPLRISGPSVESYASHSPSLASPLERVAPGEEVKRTPAMQDEAPGSSSGDRKIDRESVMNAVADLFADRFWTQLSSIRAVDEAYDLARHRAIYDLIDRGAVLGSSTDKHALELEHPEDTSHSVFVVAPVGGMLHLVV